MKSVIGFGLVVCSNGVVAGRKGEANRVQSVVGLNGYKNSIVEPAKRGANIAFTIPWI